MPKSAPMKPSRPYLRRGHPLTDGLIAAYPFFVGSGATLRDVSGRQLDGSFTNMDSTNWAVGPPGRGVTLNGTDERIVLPTDVSEKTGEGNQFSVFAVVRNTDLTQDGAVAGVWTAAASDPTNEIFQFWMDTGDNDGYRLFVIDSSGSATATSTTNADAIADTVQTVAATWDGTVASVYADGTLSDSASGARTVPVPTGTNAVIGDIQDGSADKPFPGDIFLVLWYNRAVSAGEVAALHADPLAPFITKPR